MDTDQSWGGSFRALTTKTVVWTWAAWASLATTLGLLQEFASASFPIWIWATSLAAPCVIAPFVSFHKTRLEWMRRTQALEALIARAETPQERLDRFIGILQAIQRDGERRTFIEPFTWDVFSGWSFQVYAAIDAFLTPVVARNKLYEFVRIDCAEVPKDAPSWRCPFAKLKAGLAWVETLRTSIGLPDILRVPPTVSVDSRSLLHASE